MAENGWSSCASWLRKPAEQLRLETGLSREQQRPHRKTIGECVSGVAKPQSTKTVPDAQDFAGLLDIYHVSDHLYGAAKALYGEGASAGAAWVEARRLTWVQGGGPALDEELRRQERQVRVAAKQRALADLRAYLEPHHGHTAYAGRLRQGQSIGSGMVEGAGKTVVGKRLKQTGARWRVRHAERMVALCGLLYSDLWDKFWEPTQN